jgi:hypothetical protein
VALLGWGVESNQNRKCCAPRGSPHAAPPSSNNTAAPAGTINCCSCKDSNLITSLPCSSGPQLYVGPSAPARTALGPVSTWCPPASVHQIPSAGTPERSSPEPTPGGYPETEHAQPQPGRSLQLRMMQVPAQQTSQGAWHRQGNDDAACKVRGHSLERGISH